MAEFKPAVFKLLCKVRVSHETHDPVGVIAAVLLESAVVWVFELPAFCVSVVKAATCTHGEVVIPEWPLGEEAFAVFIKFVRAEVRILIACEFVDDHEVDEGIDINVICVAGFEIIVEVIDVLADPRTLCCCVSFVVFRFE